MNISNVAFHLEQIELPENEVHLWRLDLALLHTQEQRWMQILSEDERKRARRFHFSRDRQFFTATRALLRTILANYIGAEPAGLSFRYSANDKPFLSSNHASTGIEFNVSHSGTTALLAFARGRSLGVDVEQVRNDIEHESLACRFFSAQEQFQIAALASSERRLAFFRCWTRKEAYIKASGAGLSLPLQQFDVSIQPGDEHALLATRPLAEEARRWSLRDIAVAEGYVGALCVQGHGWRLRS